MLLRVVNFSIGQTTPRRHLAKYTTVYLLQEGARAEFDAWAAHNGKDYRTPEEADSRFAVWAANVQRQASTLAAANNAAAAKVPVNGLADISLEEFKAAYLGQISRSNAEALRWAAHRMGLSPFGSVFNNVYSCYSVRTIETLCAQRISGGPQRTLTLGCSISSTKDY